MMTVSGIAAKEQAATENSPRIAAKSASPQSLAVLWSDTELRFAVIPVMSQSFLDFAATKVIIIFHPANIFLKFFLEK